VANGSRGAAVANGSRGAAVANGSDWSSKGLAAGAGAGADANGSVDCAPEEDPNASKIPWRRKETCGVSD
jgi:hypothetical protein